MVKLKSRYILLEIIGVSNIGHHTSYRIKQDVLVDQVLKDTKHLFGEEEYQL